MFGGIGMDKLPGTSGASGGLSGWRARMPASVSPEAVRPVKAKTKTQKAMHV
jgi:hypothetical protein